MRKILERSGIYRRGQAGGKPKNPGRGSRARRQAQRQLKIIAERNAHPSPWDIWLAAATLTPLQKNIVVEGRVVPFASSAYRVVVQPPADPVLDASWGFKLARAGYQLVLIGLGETDALHALQRGWKAQGEEIPYPPPAVSEKPEPEYTTAQRWLMEQSWPIEFHWHYRLGGGHFADGYNGAHKIVLMVSMRPPTDKMLANDAWFESRGYTVHRLKAFDQAAYSAVIATLPS